MILVLSIFNSKSAPDTSINLLNIAVGNTASWDYASDAGRTVNGDYVISGGWDWGYWNKIWIARLNENGELLNIWTDSITGECQPQLLPCSDNSCIIIYSDLSEISPSSIVLRSSKLNTSGNIIWQTQCDVPIENATGIRLSDVVWLDSETLSASYSVELPGGNQHVVVNTIIDSNSGDGTFFILSDRTDSHQMTVTPEGNLLHLTHNATQNENTIIVTTPDGENISFDTFVDRYSPVSIEFSLDSCLIVTRTTGGVNGVLSIVQLSESNEVQWENMFDNDLIGTFTDLALLSNGNVLAVGSTAPDENDETDGRLICLDNKGKLLWQKTIDNGADDHILSIFISDDTSILLTGTTTQFGNRDGWFLSLSSEGNYNQNCILGFDILSDDFELGFINREFWDIQLNQVDPVISTRHSKALNLQSGIITQKNATQNTIGLVFSAELTLPDEIQANSNANWISFGATELSFINMIQPEVDPHDCSFQVNFTPSETIVIETSRTEPDTSSYFPGLTLMNNLETHLIEIESQEDSLYFSADGTVLFKIPTETRPDSLYFFIEGNTSTVFHTIDNIRIYQKSW